MSDTATATTAKPSSTTRVPSVLVVLVVRQAETWLRETLAALAAQTYPRLGVIAVDNGSADASVEILVQALGEGRVLRLDEPRGLGGSVRAALELPAAASADYVLVLHDDARLDPDAVLRLVEGSIGIEGVTDVGIVGAKVVDWEDPRQLRDVGRSADRFGHPYTPLQAGEIDQGQFDRVLEVLCVSSAAMLISHEARRRAGLFDERLDTAHADVDFCWRVRIAGFRVLMTPLARVRHLDATRSGLRERHVRSDRYLEDRAALASTLKNYRFWNLLWLLPAFAALGLARLAMLLLGRRFEEAYDTVAAWGWNIANLPKTLRLRRRVQRSRRTSDGELRRFMGAAGLHLPRWFERAEEIWEEQRELAEEEEEAGVGAGRRLQHRTASLVSTHPVFVAGGIALVLAAVSFRFLLGPEMVAGGLLPTFPSTPSGFFAELDSVFRTTPLGGTLAASPALGAYGGLSWLLLASTAVAQKVVLAGAAVLGVVLLYRAEVRRTGAPGPSIVAALAYGFSGAMLWSFSEGYLPGLAALAIVPALMERIEVAFARDAPPDGDRRFVAGLAVTAALAAAFSPGLLLAGAVVVLVHVVAGPARRRGLARVLVGLAGAAILLFPFIPTLVDNAGAALGSRLWTLDVGALARLVLGGGPGTWVVALFLPVSAALCLALVGTEQAGRAYRAATVTVLALALAWLSGARYLPAGASNAPAYLALAAAAEAAIVGLGLTALRGGLGRESFGLRQIGAAAVVAVLGLGLLLQGFAALVGGWSVTTGPGAVPAAWAVVEGGAGGGSFRVLWVGGDDGRGFPSPGGEPQAVAPGGGNSLRYAITERDGASALDTGRGLSGPGAASLRDALDELLSGDTVSAGALLAPFGVRFVVADPAGLPTAATDALDAQSDLDLVPAVGLRIYRNAAAIPSAAVLRGGPDLAATVTDGTEAATIRMADVSARGLRRVPGGWAGPGAKGGGIVVVSTAFDDDWTIEASSIEPEEAFGWATAFDPSPSGPIRIRHGSQLPRTVATALLGVLWAAALWVTRRPVAR